MEPVDDEQILDGDRDAVQCTAHPTARRLVGALGGEFARLVRVHLGECIEVPEPICGVQCLVDELDRRDGSGTYPRRDC